MGVLLIIPLSTLLLGFQEPIIKYQFFVYGINNPKTGNTYFDITLANEHVAFQDRHTMLSWMNEHDYRCVNMTFQVLPVNWSEIKEIYIFEY